MNYLYYDKNGNRKKATAVVQAMTGLQPNDELILWALLDLGLDTETGRFYVTRRHILRKLRMVHKKTDEPTGEHYRIFSAACDRLRGVRYRSNAFWDPVRREHRRVDFNFFSFSAPENARSSRAWHFSLDGELFEFMKPAAAYFAFDLETVVGLDDATRRAFLVLKKIFRRRDTSPLWNLQELATNVLGYSGAVPVKKLRQLVKRVAERLHAIGMVDLSKGLFDGKGEKSVVQFHRGDYLDREPKQYRKPKLEDLPIHELWERIGVDAEGMGWLYRTFEMGLLQEWADITLVALEKFGKAFFDRSPAAWYIDNVREAAKGTRGRPDWWYEFRKEEYEFQLASNATEGDGQRAGPTEEEFQRWLGNEGREPYEKAFAEIVDVHHTGKKRITERELREVGRVTRLVVREQFEKQWRGKEENSSHGLAWLFKKVH